jgi:hypothetical protein
MPRYESLKKKRDTERSECNRNINTVQNVLIATRLSVQTVCLQEQNKMKTLNQEADKPTTKMP